MHPPTGRAWHGCGEREKTREAQHDVRRNYLAGAMASSHPEA